MYRVTKKNHRKKEWVQDNTNEQIWFQAVSVLLSVPNAGAALNTEAKKTKWDRTVMIPQNIPDSASTPCTTLAKALPTHLHLFQHMEVLWYEESRSGWVRETAQTRTSSCLNTANKLSSQQHPTADVGTTHLTITQLDDPLSMVTSTPCLHHLLK